MKKQKINIDTIAIKKIDANTITARNQFKNQKTINQFKKEILEELEEEFKQLKQWIARNRPYAEWKEVYDLKEKSKLLLLKSIDRAVKIEGKKCLDAVGKDKIRCDCKDPERTEYKEWCGCKTKDYNQALADFRNKIKGKRV